MANVLLPGGAVNRCHLLNPNSRKYGGFTHRWDIDYKLLNGATGSVGDTVYFTIGATGEKWAIMRAAVFVREAFSGAVTIYNASGTCLSVAATSTGPKLGAAGAIPGGAGFSLASTFGDSSKTMACTASSTDEAPGSYTRGSFSIYLQMVSFGKLK